jgi:hypothetical protein
MYLKQMDLPFKKALRLLLALTRTKGNCKLLTQLVLVLKVFGLMDLKQMDLKIKELPHCQLSLMGIERDPKATASFVIRTS